MLTLRPSVRIFITATPVRMCNSYDGLANAAREVIAQDPMTGHLFVAIRARTCQARLRAVGTPRRSSYRPCWSVSFAG